MNLPNAKHLSLSVFDSIFIKSCTNNAIQKNRSAVNVQLTILCWISNKKVAVAWNELWIISLSYFGTSRNSWLVSYSISLVIVVYQQNTQELLTIMFVSNPSVPQHSQTCLMALCPGLPRWASTRKVKPYLDFTVARDGQRQWHQLGHMQVCTSLQTDNRNHASTPPLSFYRPNVLPDAQPTASKHWRKNHGNSKKTMNGALRVLPKP